MCVWGEVEQGTSQSAYHVVELSDSISGLASDTVEGLHFGH